jgi:class 3 adenylate cyclase
MNAKTQGACLRLALGAVLIFSVLRVAAQGLGLPLADSLLAAGDSAAALQEAEQRLGLRDSLLRSAGLAWLGKHHPDPQLRARYGEQHRALMAHYGIRVDSGFAESLFSTGVGFTPLTPYAFLLADSSGQLGIAEIASPAFDSLFALHDESSLRRGWAYWVKIYLRNESPTRQEAHLLSYDPSELSINLNFAYRKWQSRQAFVPGRGGSFDYSWPDTSGLNLAEARNEAPIPLSLPAHSRTPVYLRIVANPVNQNRQASFELFLSDQRGERVLDAWQQRVLGFFLGMIWIQSIFFLLLWITARQRDYLYYFFYIAGLGSFLLLYQLHDSLPSAVVMYSGYVLSLGVCGWGLLKFSAGFLNLKRYAPRWLGFLRFYLPVYPVSALLILLSGLLLAQSGGISGPEGKEPPALPLAVLGLVAVLMFLWLLLTLFVLPILMTLRAWQKGSPTAAYLLIAASGLCIALFGPLLVSFVSPSSGQGLLWALGLFLGGLLLQMSTMSLSVGYREALLNREKLAAEQKLNEELQDINASIRRFVPYEFLEALGKTRVQDVRLGDSAERTITVLFSDIRSYTTLSEQLSPEETFRFLNTYLSSVGPVIRQHHGFVNQFLGDGVMALFIESPRHALEAALGTQQAVARFNEARAARGEAPIRVGIGLHAGPLMMGVIGDGERLDAGVVADAVNTASRVEGLTKFYGASVLISETVYQALGGGPLPAHRFAGRVRVKGRKTPLAVYDVFAGDPPEIAALKASAQPAFAQALGAYAAADFAQAAALFEEVLHIHPGDLAAQHYLAFSRHCLSAGTPEAWDAVEDMRDK